MRKTLFLRFSDPTGDDVCWTTTDQQGHPEPHHRCGPLAQLASAATGCRVVAFVPGTEVTLTRVAIPSHNRRRILQALPYALEERLAEDIEILHFAAGQRGTDGELAVAVVARERMDDWTTALQAAQIQPDVLIPEPLAVPHEPEGWSILVAPDISLVRTGPQAGFAAETETLDTVLAIALQEQQTPPAKVRIINCAEDKDLQPLQDALAAAGAAFVLEPCANGILHCLAGGYSDQQALNLLQGDYSRREQIGKLWRPWRPAAALLLTWLLLQGATDIMEYRQIKQESGMLAQRIEQTFREAFPETRRIVDPKVQMERGLAELNSKFGGGAGSFLGLLERTGGVLRDTPGLQLNGASYRDGYLDLDLQVNDLQVLDQLKQRLSGVDGIQAEIQSATANDNKVRSRLRIRSMTS